MKRIISILLIGLLLFQSSNVNINDILLVNNFLKHAEFHQKNYGDNLLEFLSEHYGDKRQAHHSENQKEDILSFTKIKLDVGNQSEEYIEVLNSNDFKDRKVLSKGAFMIVI